jgi:hypothetical protein
MSLPNYLARIKSSGLYRYVFDKSIIPPQSAETLRLVVGYSEKGPFNTPVYIESRQDFISLYGNINKRLEKKGVFFHRMALQALAAGPILALNVKPFVPGTGEGTTEEVNCLAFDPWDQMALEQLPIGALSVRDLYDTNRFWKLDEDRLPSIIAEKQTHLEGKYINMVATDVKDLSCSIFIRPCRPDSFDITVSDWYAQMYDTEMPSYFDGYEGRKLNEFFAEVYVFRGKFTYELCESEGTLGRYFDVEGTASNPVIKLKSDYIDLFGSPADALEALSNDPNSKFIGSYSGALLPYFKDGLGNYVSLDVLFNKDHSDHRMLMKLNDDLIEEMLADHFENVKAENYIPAISPLYIGGYDYNSISKASTALEIQDKVFDELQSKGIFAALTNHVDCEYHYIVDTFESFLEQGCKKTLSYIAKTKDNAFAILNSPAMSKFTAVHSYYGDDKSFDVKKIAINKGKFSLPTEVDGASYCAFYTPLIFGDGTVKATIPSAALVSNLYMEKWNSRQPYYIVAGPNYGRIEADGLIGPDYNYSRSDLDVLEPLGINVIIYVPRKGVFINSNQTAKQVPVSALSKAHVRELVIFLQNEIENMLQNYQWELNTPTLRDVVKTKADSILETIAANGGVYAYTNVCDETNNTPDIIDNEMIILDTAIEPARGAGKMVQRLTIHRTGGISTK